MVATLFFNNVIVAKVPVTHPSHFLMFVSGAIWFVASLLCFRGFWALTLIATLVGFVLPFFRPIY